MSWQPAQDAVCSSPADCPPVETVIVPKTHDVGGFDVKRALPSSRRRMIGPFIFFDQMGPATLPQGKGMDVRPHPHIGLSTVTWLIEGEIMHRDSVGSVQAIRPGEVNWMTAGAGIAHSERTPDALRPGGPSLTASRPGSRCPRRTRKLHPDSSISRRTPCPASKATASRRRSSPAPAGASGRRSASSPRRSTPTCASPTARR